eukprot:scaffold13372_cov62-Phaeocystis_antarctica.AAC.2
MVSHTPRLVCSLSIYDHACGVRRQSELLRVGDISGTQSGEYHDIRRCVSPRSNDGRGAEPIANERGCAVARHESTVQLGRAERDEG